MSLIDTYPEVFTALKKIVPTSLQIYLVGGAVRDVLLGRKINDFDFVAEGLVRPIGKELADVLDGKYYVLDEDRNMVRVIVHAGQPNCYNVDIAEFNGDNLKSDLEVRDFTINAIAIEFMNGQRIVDPLGGVVDLHDKKLCMCSLNSLQLDPLRALRAIRMACEFSLQMDVALVEEMKKMAPMLANCSMERCRDEFFKILNVGKITVSLELLEKFGFLPYLLSAAEKGENPRMTAHLRSLELLLKLTTAAFDEKISDNLLAGLAVLKLGSYREELKAHFDDEGSLTHPRRNFLTYAVCALEYHPDAGMSDFELVQKRSKKLILSTEEINLCVKAVQAWKQLEARGVKEKITDLEIHRYFRKFDQNGIYGILIYLAEVLSEEDIDTQSDLWENTLDQAAKMLDAWFRRYSEIVKPEKLIDGTEISEIFNIASGPRIGKMKQMAEEAQVQGLIHTRDEAVDYLKNHLDELDKLPAEKTGTI